MTALGYETPLATVVRDVASDFGIPMTDVVVNYILWEHTGYPSFWPTGRPVDDCIEQVTRYFVLAGNGWRSCTRCSRPAPFLDEVCEPCDREMRLAHSECGGTAGS